MNEKQRSKPKAFPLGTPQGEKQIPEGKEEKGDIPSEAEAGSPRHKRAPSGEEGRNKNSSQSLKKTEEVSSEEKEDEMPLDNEGKKYVSDTVEEKLSPLKEKLGVLDKVTQFVEANKKALQAIQEKASTNPPATEAKPKEAPVDPEEVARRAIQMIREEDKPRRPRRQ
ncbi:unnamed protein product [marine sediment metagenome]|uniref:Uncharacterized protein n=1 Tax=marine sediment metagenome TaxID=412755 RepID=X1MI35_9ZZZZ